MGIRGKHEVVTIDAAADLTGAQHKVIAVAGTIAPSDATALGVLQNKPESGQHASIAWMGHMKGYAGAAIAAGVRLSTTTSGYLITVTSGSIPVGKNLSGSVASGDIFDFVGNFANAGAS